MSLWYFVGEELGRRQLFEVRTAVIWKKVMGVVCVRREKGNWKLKVGVWVDRCEEGFTRPGLFSRWSEGERKRIVVCDDRGG